MRKSLRMPALAIGLGMTLAGCGGGGGDSSPPPPPVLVDAESVRPEAAVSADAFVTATRAIAASSDEVSEPRRIDAATPPDDDTSEPIPVG